MDWTNLIFIDDWGAARSRLIGDRPTIGRHSRPRNDKWPATLDALFQVLPSGGDIQVRLMGLSEKMKDLIGERPSNWQTLETDEIPVREFLSRIDFFVYFHHPNWVEAYGRTVGEAAAAGCVVILPSYLKRRSVTLDFIVNQLRPWVWFARSPQTDSASPSSPREAAR